MKGLSLKFLCLCALLLSFLFAPNAARAQPSPVSAWSQSAEVSVSAPLHRGGSGFGPFVGGGLLGALGATLLIGNIVAMAQGEPVAQGLWGLFGCVGGGINSIAGVLVASSLSLALGLALALGGFVTLVLSMINVIGRAIACQTLTNQVLKSHGVTS